MLFRSDRKSTRLNSSHTIISYAVFCLKKKRNSAGTVGEQRHPATQPVRPLPPAGAACNRRSPRTKPVGPLRPAADRGDVLGQRVQPGPQGGDDVQIPTVVGG